MRLRQIPGALWGLLALAVGMVLGTAFPAQLAFVGTGVTLAFKGLAWAAPYIIFFTIGAALVDMLRHGRAGKFAAWTGIAFTAIGLFAGLLAIVLTVPLFGLSWGSGDANAPDLLARLAGEANLLRTPSLVAVVWAFVSVFALHLLGK